MGNLTGWLAGFGAWNWLILGALLLAVEAAAPGLHIVWFGLAALLVGLIALAVPLAWQTQVVLFVVTAVALAVVARPLYKRLIAGTGAPDVNDRLAGYIGGTFEVADAIRGGRGRLKVGDSLWEAHGPDMPTGTLARVTGTNGIALVVEPAGAKT